jgi:cytochrome d ubiquinol oxidase subunit I
MEFQFGTNWAQFSKFVGDIFGAPLAAEGITAFFLESTFVGVLLFGWKRLSKRALRFASLMVALGATLSGFWIIVANSWMQTPTSFHIVNGRAELTDFFGAVFNPSTVPRYLHTICGAMMTGAFFAAGVSAIRLLKGIDIGATKRSLKIAMVFAFVSSVAQLGLGHYHAVQVAFTQPEKLATVEGLFETGPRAPAILFGIPDEKNDTIRAAIRAPGLLSLLAFGDIDKEVTGLNSFAKEERPPLALTFASFHMMVGLGMLFILLSLAGMVLIWNKKLFEQKLFLKALAFAIPLPFLANELGWITAEVGRQPWAVYHVLRTKDAVTAGLPAGNVLFSIIAFSSVYLFFFAAWIYLLRREISREDAGTEY